MSEMTKSEETMEEVVESVETTSEAEATPVAKSNAKWYVIHTYSGYENKVMNGIKQAVENRKEELDPLFEDVQVPEMQVTETKDGVRKTSNKKMYPGYVLVKMVMNEETWYIVRNIRGVTGFVGPGSKPVPLSDDELMWMGGKPEKKVNIVVDFEVGDMLRVNQGTWKDTEGVVSNINTKKQTVTILVEMFGRETPVEINFTDVTKIV